MVTCVQIVTDIKHYPWLSVHAGEENDHLEAPAGH